MTIALITHPECLLHNPGIDHPESPERLRVISKELGLAGLEPFLIHEIAPLVSHEQLSRVHTEDYIESLLKLTPHDGVIAIDADTVISPHTLLAARYAAGAVVIDKSTLLFVMFVLQDTMQSVLAQWGFVFSIMLLSAWHMH